MDVVRKVKFKVENNNDKSNPQNRIKMEVVNEINLMRRVFKDTETWKKYYCCVSVMHMLNNCEIRENIKR